MSRYRVVCRDVSDQSKDPWVAQETQVLGEAIQAAKTYTNELLTAVVLDQDDNKVYPILARESGNWIVLIPASKGSKRTIALRKGGVVLSWKTAKAALVEARRVPEGRIYSMETGETLFPARGEGSKRPKDSAP